MVNLALSYRRLFSVDEICSAAAGRADVNVGRVQRRVSARRQRMSKKVCPFAADVPCSGV